MPKITGVIEHGKKPFYGVVIITALSGKVSQYPVKSGKPDEDLVLVPGFYNVSFVPEDAKRVSSYPQYKWRVPEVEGDSVEFSKIEVEQLV